MNDTENSGYADDQNDQRSLILASYSADGAIRWRRDVYPVVREDVMRHMAQGLLKAAGKNGKPDVVIEIDRARPANPARTIIEDVSPSRLRLTATVYPAGGEGAGVYSVTLTYRVRFRAGKPVPTLLAAGPGKTSPSG